MRMHVLIAMLVLGSSAGVLQAGEAAGRLQDGDHVAVLGDHWAAIYGRPELAPEPYYVLITDYLVMCKPAGGLGATEFGMPQTTSYGYAFYGGLANDVLRFHPNAATVWFGMSESGWAPLTPEKEKSIRDGLTLVVQKMKAANVHLIALGSPGYVDPTWRAADQVAALNKTFETIRDIAKDVAAKEGVAFADVFDTMKAATEKGKAKYGEKFALSYDAVWRPSRAGSLVVAYTFLKALGCSGDIGTITVDMTAGKAEPTEGHRILSVAKGEVRIESSKYPFCFQGDAAKADSTRAVPEIIPFNEELNRFHLVVRNVGADKATVTWGKGSKEFTATQLGKGINLAAEFTDNPFAESFAKVEERIIEQQKVETVLSNVLMNRLVAFASMIPSTKDVTDQLASATAKNSNEARGATAAAVKTITHTISITTAK